MVNRRVELSLSSDFDFLIYHQGVSGYFLNWVQGEPCFELSSVPTALESGIRAEHIFGFSFIPEKKF